MNITLIKDAGVEFIKSTGFFAYCISVPVLSLISIYIGIMLLLFINEYMANYAFLEGLAGRNIYSRCWYALGVSLSMLIIIIGARNLW